jgi:hypothetical protein
VSTYLVLIVLIILQKARQCPVVGPLSAKINRPASSLSNLVLLSILTVLILNPAGLAPHMSSIVTIGTGVYGTGKYLYDHPSSTSYSQGGSIEPAAKVEMQKWLDYWVMIGALHVTEGFVGDHLISKVFPLYLAAKGLFVVWFLVSTTVTYASPQKPLRVAPLVSQWSTQRRTIC